MPENTTYKFDSDGYKYINASQSQNQFYWYKKSEFIFRTVNQVEVGMVLHKTTVDAQIIQQGMLWPLI